MWIKIEPLLRIFGEVKNTIEVDFTNMSLIPLQLIGVVDMKLAGILNKEGT